MSSISFYSSFSDCQEVQSRSPFCPDPCFCFLKKKLMLRYTWHTRSKKRERERNRLKKDSEWMRMEFDQNVDIRSIKEHEKSNGPHFFCYFGFVYKVFLNRTVKNRLQCWIWMTQEDFQVSSQTGQSYKNSYERLVEWHTFGKAVNSDNYLCYQYIKGTQSVLHMYV